MSKRNIAILFVAVFLTALTLNFVRAQNDSDQGGAGQGLANIEKRLGELVEASKENKEIIRKLDMVLDNQQKILSELAIVKVRASRR